MDVEERLRDQLPVLDDADETALLDDEQAAAAVAGVDDIERRVEAAGYELEAETDGGRVD